MTDLDLSVVILALPDVPIVDQPRKADSGSQAETVPQSLLAELQAVLARLGISYEVALVTTETSSALPVRVVSVGTPGYGLALRAGLAAARGRYLLTLDDDFVGDLSFIERLWAEREAAEIVIASRYVPGGAARMPRARVAASRGLNRLYGRALSLSIRDFSSGFRLYRRSVVQGLPLAADGYEILQEILVRAYGEGWRVLEVPFVYETRHALHSRPLRFGAATVLTGGVLWQRRNSILCADYDDRAHDSVIPLQRYWQRQRFRHITDLIRGEGPALDVGCGSSRILSALPPGSIGLDILLRKLRYARRFDVPLVNGSGFCLPFADHAFSCVVCSQVIEHVPMDSPILDELCRVLAPGGRLVLGTPDYAHWEWRVTETLYGWAAPGGYADEHIAHYTREGLVAQFAQRGFRHEATRYILRGELILAFRKGTTMDH